MNQQTDLLILDFSKAFDKVANKRLLLKLEYYGIRGLVLPWIKVWLIGRTQQVVLESEYSEKSCVRSGDLQGTLLGPLCFLLFVNDIGNDITSYIKLFADDTLLMVWYTIPTMQSKWSEQISWTGKVVANGLQTIEVLRSTRLQNQVSFYTPVHYA